VQDRLRDYEMVLVLDPSLEETAIQDELGKCREVIESHGGTLSKTDVWGRRKLAYEIKKRTDGFYVLLGFKAKPGIARDLDQELRVREPVLRYLTVLAPPRSDEPANASSDNGAGQGDRDDDTPSSEEDTDAPDE
jgi:small subunit ribosomal protein S6